MGGVALVRKQDTSDLAALKFLLPALALNSRSQQLFFREVDNMEALRHPNIVELLAAGADGDTLFLLMEYCDLGTVLDLMAQSGGTISPDTAVSIAFEVLDGLEHAHKAVIPSVRLANGTYGVGAGLVHRDIKPPNMLRKSRDAAAVTKLADYGLAKAFNLAGKTDMTKAGSRGGTAEFMPRQQVVQYLYAKPEVDIWAVAASLYFMLTGHTPRDFSSGLSGPEKLNTVLYTEPVPIRKRGVPVPKRLSELLDRALDDRSGLAFQDVASFRTALRASLG
jgi:serine/threonine protein kinase